MLIVMYLEITCEASEIICTYEYNIRLILPNRLHVFLHVLQRGATSATSFLMPLSKTDIVYKGKMLMEEQIIAFKS